LYKKCVAAEFVQLLLTGICQELLYRTNEEETFLKNFMTGEETWVYGYDFETKGQSTQRI
jgi:hypothetical protein